MKRLLVGLFFVLVILSLANPTSTSAQILFPEKAQSGATGVTATVGQFFLNITGYQSPNASIVIETVSGIFLSSTTADGNGYFSLSDILIKDDFPGFCFSAIDFKRIGESESCIEIGEVITEDKTYNDVFLPPTIGLSKKIIAAGEDAIIYGYSMPFAEVVIKFDEESITLQADGTGYYEYTFADVPAGVYSFSSVAALNGKPSLEPKNRAVLEALTLEEQIRKDLTGLAEEAEKRFPGILIFAPLLLLLIGLLIALLWKTKPKWLMVIFDRFKRRYPMHHDYFLFKQ